jgi:glycopeptide antibiotics resistance protein
VTIKDLKDEFVGWKFSRARGINLAVGVTALLIYEFFARPIYRPYIYSHKINDFHIADTIGNSLGTIATIFIFLSLIGNTRSQHEFLIKTITISLILYEVVHPFLGKPMDVWDVLATLVTGVLCWVLYRIIHRKANLEV